MKKVLSLLVAFVFLQVQTWALSGGPVYAGNSAVVRGTYSGILIGSLPAGSTTASGTNANQLGVFAIGMPSEGLGSGIFAFFGEGSTFYGSIVATIDPLKLKLAGLIKGQANTVTFTTSTNANGISTTNSANVPFGFADGTIEAKLSYPGGAAASGGARVTGTAFLEVAFLVDNPATIPVDPVITPFGTAELMVDGFQQSATVTGLIDLDALTGNENTVGN